MNATLVSQIPNFVRLGHLPVSGLSSECASSPHSGLLAGIKISAPNVRYAKCRGAEGGCFYAQRLGGRTARYPSSASFRSLTPKRRSPLKTMKIKFYGSIFAAVLLLVGCSFAAKAQTTTNASGGATTIINPVSFPASANAVTAGFEAIGQAVLDSTNWTVATFAGADTTFAKYIVGVEAAYGFNQYVGLVAGVEDLFSKGHQSQFSAVKGGLSLQFPLHPFAFLGSTALTNVVASPFISDQIATPSGSANLGNLTIEGLNFNLVGFSNFEVVGGVDYEQRTGQGYWNANYWLVHFGISRRW